MRFHVLTVFPEMIENAAGFGVVGQAWKEGLISVRALSPRKFTSNVHQTIDDRPFGGGDGMIMMAEPLDQALKEVRSGLSADDSATARVIHLSPRGKPFTNQKAHELAVLKDIVLIASRYGGVDQRFLNHSVHEEISIGDYILSGGELASLVVIDAVSRLLPGVLGNVSSSADESFSARGGGLEHPQYTRPREWQGQAVPAALLSGHHAEIGQWKDVVSLLVTLERRPDLAPSPTSFKPKERAKIEAFVAALTDSEKNVLGLSQDINERWREYAAKGQTK